MLIFWIWKVALIWQVFPNSFLEQQVLYPYQFHLRKWTSSHDIFTHDFIVFMQFFCLASILFSQMIFYSQDIQKCPTISRVFLNEEKLALLGLHTISKSRILSKNSTLTNLYFWGIFEFLAPNLEYLTKYFIDFLWKNHHFLQTKKKRKEKKILKK